MEYIKEILLYGGLTFTVLAILYFLASLVQSNRFQKNMKVGDNCSVFVGEDRTEGKIMRVDGDVITVSTYLYGTIKYHRRNVY